MAKSLRWEPRIELTAQERVLLDTVKRTRKLYGFLRCYRDQLFNESFQAELASVYRDTGAGKDPLPPAFMAMVVLLQAYAKISDAEAVQRSVTDLLWQMALDCLGDSKAPFSQGALHDFRQRLIANNLDRRLLERTAELARETSAFDAKRIPQTLRMAADSKPLRGAGRVEDTINLLGHAAQDIVWCIADLLDESPEVVAHVAGIPLVLESSTKFALDTDWTDPKKKAKALQRLLTQLECLRRFIDAQLPGAALEPPLKERLETLQGIIGQDLEPDPSDSRGKKKRIRKGVAKDRRPSIKDPEMRHGRKTKSKAFNGFKQHVAMDLDRRLILACTVVPANRREFDALPTLQDDLARYPERISEMHVDRGYVTPALCEAADNDDCEVVSKPRQMPPNDGRFTKRDFKFNLKDRTVTCPAGQTKPFQPGMILEFDEATCQSCKLRESCTRAKRGRALQIPDDEIQQQRFLRLTKTRDGRKRLRERIVIEHRLAHIAQKQGDRARYIGIRANVFDLRRTAALVNLELIDHELSKAA